MKKGIGNITLKKLEQCRGATSIKDENGSRNGYRLILNTSILPGGFLSKRNPTSLLSGGGLTTLSDHYARKDYPKYFSSHSFKKT